MDETASVPRRRRCHHLDESIPLRFLVQKVLRSPQREGYFLPMSQQAERARSNLSVAEAVIAQLSPRRRRNNPPLPMSQFDEAEAKRAKRRLQLSREKSERRRADAKEQEKKLYHFLDIDPKAPPKKSTKPYDLPCDLPQSRDLPATSAVKSRKEPHGVFLSEARKNVAARGAADVRQFATEARESLAATRAQLIEKNRAKVGAKISKAQLMASVTDDRFRTCAHAKAQLARVVDAKEVNLKRRHFRNRYGTVYHSYLVAPTSINGLSKSPSTFIGPGPDPDDPFYRPSRSLSSDDIKKDTFTESEEERHTTTRDVLALYFPEEVSEASSLKILDAAPPPFPAAAAYAPTPTYSSMTKDAPIVTNNVVPEARPPAFSPS